METADQEIKRSLPSVRMSLRRFKRTPDYRALLENILSQKELPSMGSLERRRLRLDRVDAALELAKIKRGEELGEFDGLMYLPDSLRGFAGNAEGE
ncbi:MAG: hypothetical protein LV473_21010 [Nitrospira sp.]|nr:hypothetical protein [Nitrospira sp.]